MKLSKEGEAASATASHGTVPQHGFKILVLLKFPLAVELALPLARAVTTQALRGQPVSFMYKDVFNCHEDMNSLIGSRATVKKSGSRTGLWGLISF